MDFGSLLRLGGPHLVEELFSYPLDLDRINSVLESQDIQTQAIIRGSITNIVNPPDDRYKAVREKTLVLFPKLERLGTHYSVQVSDSQELNQLAVSNPELRRATIVMYSRDLSSVSDYLFQLLGERQEGSCLCYPDQSIDLRFILKNTAIYVGDDSLAIINLDTRFHSYSEFIQATNRVIPICHLQISASNIPEVVKINLECLTSLLFNYTPNIRNHVGELMALVENNTRIVDLNLVDGGKSETAKEDIAGFNQVFLDYVDIDHLNSFFPMEIEGDMEYPFSVLRIWDYDLVRELNRGEEFNPDNPYLEVIMTAPEGSHLANKRIAIINGNLSEERLATTNYIFSSTKIPEIDRIVGAEQ